MTPVKEFCIKNQHSLKIDKTDRKTQEICKFILQEGCNLKKERALSFEVNCPFLFMFFSGMLCRARRYIAVFQILPFYRVVLSYGTPDVQHIIFQKLLRSLLCCSQKSLIPGCFFFHFLLCYAKYFHLIIRINCY